MLNKESARHSVPLFLEEGTLLSLPVLDFLTLASYPKEKGAAGVPVCAIRMHNIPTSKLACISEETQIQITVNCFLK